MQYSAAIFSRVTHSPTTLFLSLLLPCIALKLALLDLSSASSFPINMSLAFIVALLLAGIKYQSEDKPVRVITTGISLMFGFYALTNYPAYGFESSSEAILFETARYLTCLFALISIWRPSFALVPLLYTAWRKHIDIANTGFNLSETDYMPVVEVGFLLLAGLLLLNLASRFLPEFKQHRQAITGYLLLAAIGIHFGNYFHSGLAKLMLDGGPTSWVTDNHTYYLINVALELGTLPISQFPQLTQYVYDLFSEHYILLNTITLVGQLACILLITSPARIIFITLFYDAMHVLIFLTTGIFFWKWIILNMLIVAAMRVVTRDSLTRPAVITGVLFTLFGILLFFTARLAWYDTQTLRHVYVQATSISGYQYNVPTNYFLNASVTFAQGRLLPAYPGHFALTNAMGSTASHQAMQLLNQCTPPMYYSEQELQYHQLEKLIRSNHSFISRKESATERFNYDLFPHHIWSNPVMYSEFKQLDKRSINHYNIVLESKCLKIAEGTGLHAVVERSSSPDIVVYER